MKRRTIALILSVMMLVSLLSAIPFTNVSAADQEFTGTVGGDFNTASQGNVKVTAPTQVNVGDTFEIVYEFYNLEVTNGSLGCFVINNVIDTRYVHITAADPTSVYIKECDISTWTDASNYGTVAGLAAIEATDKTTENLVDFNWGFVNEEVISAIDDSITVVGKYVATTAGTTTIKAYDLNINELYYDWEGYFEPATFDIEIDIVDPSATPEPEPDPEPAPTQEFTGTVGGDFNTASQGNVKVTAPTQVNVGETFEIVYEFYNLEVTNGSLGCFVVNNVIDTRYVHITAADPTSVYIKECDISTWTDASNYGTVAGLAAIEATDKTTENPVDFNWGFVNEEVISAIDDSITVVGKYVASTVGTTTIKAYDLNINELYYDWEGYFEPATFDIEIDIVDPSADPEPEPDPEPAPTQEFTGTVGGDFNTASQGNVKVTAPTQVNVGETFEIVYEFYNLEVTNGSLGCFVINNVIDTRYVHITAADPTSVYIKECDISTWTDASNYGTVAGLAAIEATDKTVENPVDFNWGFVNEEVISEIDDSITVVGKYVASTVGTTTIKAYDLNINELYYDWEGYFVPATFDIEIDIVDPSATPEDPSEEPQPEEYTVTWVVDGVSTEETYTEGEVPSFKGTTDKAADAQYTYTFTGWDKEIVAVTGDVTYTAQYSTTVNKYTITWVVDGVTTTDSVAYGTVPSFSGSTDKAGDAQYTYTFDGWDKEIVAVTGDATYTAQYTSTVNEYTVTWIVDGNTTTETYAYGATPSFKGSTDKPADDEYTYTFTGWSPAIAVVTGDATYTAQYSNGTNSYTVTWIVDGVSTEETYNYGEVPSFKGSTDKAADAQYTYTFDGWDAEIVAVTGNATYTAKYTSTVNEYTITWIVDGVTYTDTVAYGEVPSFSGSTDKAADAQYTYTFDGWDAEVVAVTGDATYTAKYTSTVNQYTVTFVVGAQGVADGQLEWTVDYGTAGSAITVPTVVASGAAYEFTGWDKEVPATITEDVVITAKFATTGSAVTITFVQGDNGTIIGKNDAGETVVGGYSIAVASGSKISEALAGLVPSTIADENYHFVGWFADGVEVNGDALLEGDLTLEAVFAINALTVTDVTVDASTGMYASGKIYVDVNDGSTVADLNASAYRLYTFMHTEDGKTNIATARPVFGEDSNGVYMELDVATNNGYASMDIYLSANRIDFSTEDWGVIDVFTGYNF